MDNVLIVNSRNNHNKSFLSLFNDLSGFNFFTWASDDYFLDKFLRKDLNKKISLGPNISKKINFYIFLLISSFFYFWFFSELFFNKSKYKLKAIICISDNEKIIFTPIARILGIKMIWIDEVGVDYRKRSKILVLLLKLCSNFSKIITFTEFKKKELLSLGFCEKNINNVSLGIRLEKPSHQENIFSNLAEVSKPMSFLNNFTIGTIANLNNRGQIEMLLQMTKTCLGLIPNLQLVVIGSGKERKNYGHLARRMEIEKNVWFVGEQEHLGKWFENFDIYIALSKKFNLFDLEIILEAMSKKLLVIAGEDENLKELIIDKKTGLFIDFNNIENFSRKIIELEQDKRQINTLGENACNLVSEYFSREVQLGRINKTLDL